MSDGALRQKVVIRNPQGFHMRPKAAFVKLASGFPCDVRVCWNGQAFNGKSMFELMLLAAEQGQEVVVEAAGAGADEAVPALAAVLAAVGEEAEGPTSPQLNNS